MGEAKRTDLRVRFDGRQLMSTVCREVGLHPAGSPGMREAAQLLAAEWRGFGAEDVHTEPVPVNAWEQVDSVVELQAPVQRSYASMQYVYSGSGTVEAPVIWAGDASSEELDRLGDQIRGAIVLVKSHELSGGGNWEPIQKRISLLEQKEAAGVLVASRHPELPVNEWMYRSVSIPVLSLPGKEAAELEELAKKQYARVRLEAAGRSTEAECVNLIGEMGCGRPADETIILSAHLDGSHIAPSAFDNITGVVTLTEAARALAPYKDSFVRNLRIIAYTGEECGFLGSKEYVRAHAEDLNRIRFVLNLDSLFDDTARGVAVMWAPEMRDYIEDALLDLDSEVDVRNFFCMSSDYLPFMLEGIPAARPASYVGPYLPWSHTTEDTDDKIAPEWLQANATVCARMLFRMLTDDQPLPSERKTAQEVRELIEQEDVADTLRYLGFGV